MQCAQVSKVGYDGMYGIEKNFFWVTPIKVGGDFKYYVKFWIYVFFNEWARKIKKVYYFLSKIDTT